MSKNLDWQCPDSRWMPPVSYVVRRVAVSGAGLAECWARLLGPLPVALTGVADSSPTAEVPQSPKRGLRCPASRSYLAKYCHIHLGVSQVAGSEQRFGSTCCRVPQCAADCNFGKTSPKLIAFRRRSGATAATSTQLRGTPSQTARVHPEWSGGDAGRGFVGFVGLTLAIAARIQRQSRRPQIDRLSHDPDAVPVQNGGCITQFRRIRSGMNLGRLSGSGTYKTYRTGF
jgi:hypothetical protein